MEPVIEIKNVGKRYNITHQRGGYIALRDVITNILRSPMRFLKKKAKQVAGLETKEDFWALKNISFDVHKGEVVGIIGANGAGKSTLLKILSQITPPTEGEIIMRGRVGSLLEVGTGFHPELSGRENIFLNGAILGMTGKEIAKKFDEIVAFAGIEKFLDTPVKHYSSGMYVRLAFSVAAHMEPDILIVDEVLAVGDIEFQKKCLGKMDEITKKDGRTILFVSHNMGAIKSLCTKTVLLEKGEISNFGPTDQVINSYLHSSKPKMDNLINTSIQNRAKRSHGHKVAFDEVISLHEDGTENEKWMYKQNEAIHFSIKSIAKEKAEGLSFYLTMYDIESGLQITSAKEVITTKNLEPEEVVSFNLAIPPYSIRAGQYRLYLGLRDGEGRFVYDVIDANVNLPPIIIEPSTDNPDENKGFFTIPMTIKTVSDIKQ